MSRNGEERRGMTEERGGMWRNEGGMKVNDQGPMPPEVEERQPAKGTPKVESKMILAWTLIVRKLFGFSKK